MTVEPGMLRVMSYNIRACLGIDAVRSVERIAEIIRRDDPHIVALQEVDSKRRRSGYADQAAELGEALNMHVVFAPSFHEGWGSYGNAVLSRTPMHIVRHELLPIVQGTEPRSVMWVSIECGEHTIDVVNTHLSFRRADRPRQVDVLLNARWFGSGELSRNGMLCGDLNCSLRNRGYRRLHHVLDDAQTVTSGRAKCTWPTRRPVRRLDHILVGTRYDVVECRVSRSGQARLASDHFPLVADLIPRSMQ